MRFVYDMSSMSRKKLKDAVVVNMSLDMNEILGQTGKGTKSVVYELVAVLNHEGKSAHSGHYTADIQHCEAFSGVDKRWFKFDDARVTLSQLDTIADRNARNAYMLLYRQKMPDVTLMSPSTKIASVVNVANTDLARRITQYEQKVGLDDQSLLVIRIGAGCRGFDRGEKTKVHQSL